MGPRPSSQSFHRVTGGRRGAHRRPTRTNRLLVVVDFALAVTAVFAISYHFAHHGHRAATPARATSQSIGSAVPPSTRQLVQWLHADLPTSTRVVADADTAALLQRSGRLNVTTDLGACHAPDVVFLTAALATSAGQHPLLAHCISAAHTI